MSRCAALVVSSKEVPHSQLLPPPHPFPRCLFPFLAIAPVSYQHPFKRGLKTRNGAVRSESERLSLSQICTDKWLFRKMLFQRGSEITGITSPPNTLFQIQKGKEKEKDKKRTAQSTRVPLILLNVAWSSCFRLQGHSWTCGYNMSLANRTFLPPPLRNNRVFSWNRS